MSKVRTLGLFYGNLSLGGIQRGASFQIPMFASWGCRVVLLTVQPAGPEDYVIPGAAKRVVVGAPTLEERSSSVEKAVREHGIDLVIYHIAYSASDMQADIAGAHRGGAKTAVFWHSVFSHFWLRKHRQFETKGLFDVCLESDAMITLTRTDESFFRMLGIPSLAIPYSDPDLMGEFVRKENPRRVLWMSRFIELKRPLDAVRIFEKVLARFPDAEFYVLGESKEPRYSVDPRPYVSRHPELAKAVHFEGFKKDVRPYLEKCGVGLVTSRFEGYGHAIVEMKMASMPVVAYSMPYLDTLKPDSGAVCVPQGDIDAAAAAICRLFDSPEEFRRQGEKARSSFFEITSTDQKASYGRLFRNVETGDFSDMTVPDVSTAKSAVETAIEHAGWALRLMDLTVREEWRQDRSYRLGRILTWPYRKAKRILRRIVGREAR